MSKPDCTAYAHALEKELMAANPHRKPLPDEEVLLARLICSLYFNPAVRRFVELGKENEFNSYNFVHLSRRDRRDGKYAYRWTRKQAWGLMREVGDLAYNLWEVGDLMGMPASVNPWKDDDSSVPSWHGGDTPIVPQEDLFGKLEGRDKSLSPKGETMATAKHLDNAGDSAKEQWKIASSIHTVGEEAISLLKALGKLSADKKRKTDAVVKASEIIAQRNEEVRPLLIKVRDHIAKGGEANGCSTWEAWATHAGYSVRNLNYIVNGRKSRKDGNPGSRKEKAVRPAEVQAGSTVLIDGMEYEIVTFTEPVVPPEDRGVLGKPMILTMTVVLKPRWGASKQRERKPERSWLKLRDTEAKVAVALGSVTFSPLDVKGDKAEETLAKLEALVKDHPQWNPYGVDRVRRELRMMQFQHERRTSKAAEEAKKPRLSPKAQKKTAAA